MTQSNPTRRGVTVLAVAASLLAIVGGAFAFAHSGGAHHARGKHAPGMHLEHMKEMLEKIGASDTQTTQIENILKPALNEMQAAHQAHFAAFTQFHEAISAPSIDRGRLESLRAEQVKSLDEASKRVVTALTDAAEVLSPEQRAALGREIAQHHGG
jgi:protein CpxP